jgi:hypothetical protein
MYTYEIFIYGVRRNEQIAILLHGQSDLNNFKEHASNVWRFILMKTEYGLK